MLSGAAHQCIDMRPLCAPCRPSRRAVTQHGGGRPHREAQEVAGPSLGLAAGVLTFLGVAFSGVDSSQAGFDLDYRVGTTPECTCNLKPR